MSTHRTTIGLQIQGLGLFDDNEEATIWQYESWRHIKDVAKPDEWQEHTLKELPRGVSSSIDPFKREWANSAFVFRLPATQNVLKTLLWQVNEPFALLNADVGAADTTLPIDVEGLDGRVVFLGSETIRLGTYSGGEYIDCDRHWWSSVSSEYSEGQPVFAGPPKLKDRLVWIVQVDLATRTVKRKWRGFLQDVTTDSTFTTVDVQCSEFFSSIARLRLNQDAKNLAIGSSLERVQTPTGDWIQGYIPDYKPRMRKLDQAGAGTVWLDVDGRLIRGIYNGRGVSVARSDNLVTFDNFEPEFIDEDEIIKKTRVTNAFEVFFVSQEADDQFLGGNVSTTSALFDPYNRVAIAYAILVSTLAAGTTTVPDTSLGYVDADVFGPGFMLDIEG